MTSVCGTGYLKRVKIQFCPGKGVGAAEATLRESKLKFALEKGSAPRKLP